MVSLRLKIVLILFFIGLSGPHGQEAPYPSDESGRVRFLEDILNENGSDLIVKVVEDFESDKGWNIQSDSPLQIFRPVFRTPESPAFFREARILRKFVDPSFPIQKGFFLHTSFTRPGREAFRVCRRNPETISGSIRNISLWVYTKPSLHRLDLIASNGKEREILIPLERLQWNGWKRLEGKIPAGMFSDISRRSLPEFKIDCIQITSSSLEKAGDLSLILDNLLVLVHPVQGRRKDSLEYDGW